MTELEIFLLCFCILQTLLIIHLFNKWGEAIKASFAILKDWAVCDTQILKHIVDLVTNIGYVGPELNDIKRAYLDSCERLKNYEKND